LEKGFLFLLDDWRRRNKVCDSMDVVDDQYGLMHEVDETVGNGGHGAECNGAEGANEVSVWGMVIPRAECNGA
jgi:hypothetical protein